MYDNRLIIPNDEMLVVDLGESKNYLDQICEFIELECGHLKLEWKYCNKKSGWLLKLFNTKRNVLFVVPCEKYFRTAFTFGQVAFEAILSGDFPEGVKTDLMEARKYVKGRGLQVEVRTQEDMMLVLQLIKIKLAN